MKQENKRCKHNLNLISQNKKSELEKTSTGDLYLRDYIGEVYLCTECNQYFGRGWAL